MASRKKPIPLYLTSLKLENVRCFSDERLLLAFDGRQPAHWTLILGENGVGKTTLLECLAGMRLDLVNPIAPEESESFEQDDDYEDRPPLTKGQLGPVLLVQENEAFESLLQLGNHREWKLDVEFSSGGTLSSRGKNSTVSTVPGKPRRSGKVVRSGIKASFTRGRLVDAKPLRKPTIERTFNGEFHEPILIAYWANRHMGRGNLTADAMDISVAPGDSEVTVLLDMETVLIALDHASKADRAPELLQLDRLKNVLTQILPGDEFRSTDIEIYPYDVLDRGARSGVFLRTSFGLVHVSALSLGYQTAMAWAADLAWRLLMRFPGSPDPLSEPAVVLIDEIDLHLHPLWQLGIIDKISAIFPNTQFIASSHSPLMAQVAEEANYVLLRKRENDVEIVNDPIVVMNWRVDQILTSELFGIPGARNENTELIFKKRDELAAMPSRTPEQDTELEGLRVQISEIPSAGDPQDQEAMDLIRKAAALLKKDGIVSP